MFSPHVIAVRCRFVLAATLFTFIALFTTVHAFNDRRLIIAYGASGSEQGRRFEALVDEQRCQLIERDVDVYLVDTAEVAWLASASPGDSENLPSALVTYRGEGEFELVLVGKDGGVKARASTPEALSEFLVAIDGMPMRRAEAAAREKTDC